VSRIRCFVPDIVPGLTRLSARFLKKANIYIRVDLACDALRPRRDRGLTGRPQAVTPSLIAVNR
jgi:hypothetical protein